MDNKDDFNDVAHNKEELISVIERMIQEMRGGELEKDRLTKLTLLQRLLDRVKRGYFPELINDGWRMIAEVTDTVASVFLLLTEYEEEMKNQDKDYAFTIKEIFQLIEINV